MERKERRCIRGRGRAADGYRRKNDDDEKKKKKKKEVSDEDISNKKDTKNDTLRKAWEQIVRRSTS